MSIEEKIAFEAGKELRFKYLIIRDLCFLLASILPQEETKNLVRDYDGVLQELGDQERSLYNLLVHQMTLLNRMYRIKEAGYYMSEKEDLVLALNLFGSNLNPLGYMSMNIKNCYLALESYFGNTIFKATESRRILGLKKTQNQRVLNALASRKLLYKHERKGSGGYLYQILKKVEKGQ